VLPYSTVLDLHGGKGLKTTPPGFMRGLRLPGDQDEDKTLTDLAALEENAISTESQNDHEVYGILITVSRLLSDFRILLQLHLMYRMLRPEQPKLTICCLLLQVIISLSFFE
jgi:hypothetical protein